MKAFDQIIENIKVKKSFVLEAGAGSGKTYTLIQTLNYLLEKNGRELKFNNQNIVCITYTNVAKNEIISRIENNPLVLVSTIHEFLWDCIKSYNKQLIIEFDKINSEKHREKPDKHELNLIDRIHSVEYNDRVYSDFEDGKVGHDDLIILAQKMFVNNKLLTSIIANKFPFIFIDEYQDTAPETINSLINYLLDRNKDKIVIGFYGDSYQKIYDTGIGSLQNYIHTKKLELVPKVENYRSSVEVVNLLNKVRDNITQEIPEDKTPITGSVKFINCINYPDRGKLKVREYESSLIPLKNENYDNVNLVKFYNDLDYNSIIGFLKNSGSQVVRLNTHPDKKKIIDKVQGLINIREKNKVRDVFDYIVSNQLISLNKGVVSLLERVNIELDSIEDEDVQKRVERDKSFFNSIMDLPYKEYINLFKHSQNENVFSTKHGTKGDEYRNVLVIIDDTSWKQKYNFQNFFDGTEDKPDRKLRTKNLFYVSCSRAKENLVVLSLSKMEDQAMETVKKWYGEENVTII